MFNGVFKVVDWSNEPFGVYEAGDGVCYFFDFWDGRPTCSYQEDE